MPAPADKEQQLLSIAAIREPTEILSVLHSQPQGLSETDVQKRLSQYGKNTIGSNSHSTWHIFARQWRSPFVYLLLVAAAISFFLGERIDVIVIGIFIALDVILGFYQEYRSEKTLRFLAKTLEKRVTVCRNGIKNIVTHAGLVPGDVILLHPGDIIPADIRFISAEELLIDESSLTGESVPVQKTHLPPAHQPTTPMAAPTLGFAGTTVIGGTAEAIIIATGHETMFGKIASLSAETKRKSTFDERISKLSTFTLIIVSITLILLFGASLILKPQTNILQLAIFAVALAVSVIPEGLPVVTTFSLSLGALRLAKSHVVVKRLSAIEDLGSIDLLCSDKTGTLTENKMTVSDIWGKEQEVRLLARLMASTQTKEQYHGNSSFTDAIMNAYPETPGGYELLETIPFDPERKRTTALFRTPQKKYLIISMGAPSQSTSADETEFLRAKGKEGKRILSINEKLLSARPKKLAEEELTVKTIGYITFTDPIKPTTKHAVTEAKRLGVQLKMITGDSREVAGFVAHQIGLITSPDEVITGDELAQLSQQKLRDTIKRIHVFARITPEQKYTIVSHLRETNTVGFLGEGINDAPALKRAHVGMVVDHASDVAREAADIVLLKKSLSVIIDGIREGRKVYVNTTKYVTATLSANFGNFFAVATSSLLIDTLPMLPIHLLLVNLFTDMPMIAIASDSVDEDQLQRPSMTDYSSFTILSLVLGGVSTLFDFIVFGTFVRLAPGLLQTGWFMASILSELLFLFSIRTRKLFFQGHAPSPSVFILTGLAFALAILLPAFPATQKLLSFVPLPRHLYLTVIGIVLLYFVATEIVKRLTYRFMLDNDKKNHRV